MQSIPKPAAMYSIDPSHNLHDDACGPNLLNQGIARSRASSTLTSMTSTTSTEDVDENVENWSKARLLRDFEESLSADAPQTVQTALRNGLLDSGSPVNQYSSTADRLFKNRFLYTRQCTRSGSLALAALAFKTFGTNLIAESGPYLDRDKLTAAMYLLFGKEMARISNDFVTNIGVTLNKDTAQYQLTCGDYELNVIPNVFEERQDSLEDLVTTQTAQPSFFHDKRSTCLAGLLKAGDKIPRFIVDSIGLNYQKQPAMSGARGIRHVTRLAANMDKGDVMYQNAHVKISFIAPSNPSIYHQVAAEFDAMEPMLLPEKRTTNSACYTAVKSGSKAIGTGTHSDRRHTGLQPNSSPLRSQGKARPSLKPGLRNPAEFPSGFNGPSRPTRLYTTDQSTPHLIEHEEPVADLQFYDPKSRAMNAYKIDVDRDGMVSTFYGVAAQIAGDASQNAQAAELVVQGIFDGELDQGRRPMPASSVPDPLDLRSADDVPQTHDDETERGEAPGMRRILLDIRFNNEQIKGSIYQRHIEAMDSACHNLGVTYLSVFQKCHDRSGGLTGSVAAAMQMEGLAHPSTSGPNRDKYADSPIQTVLDCYTRLPDSTRVTYGPALDMWVAAMRNTEIQSNATALVLYSDILTEVFQRHKESTKIDLRLSIGCKSADHQTSAVVTGVVMAGSLLRDELKGAAGRVNLQRIMSVGAHGSVLHYDALTTSEKLLLANNYDPSLMLASSRSNSGLATNPNAQALKEFARNVDFVAQDTFYTVRPVTH